MKRLISATLPVIGLLLFYSFAFPVQESDTNKYKCMVQLKNYRGHGAYIMVSVLDKDNKYLKTLRVLGDDEEWYPDLSNWWAFHTQNNKPNIDGITGATIAGGERSIFSIEIEQELIDAGNSLRFETAVEDQKYILSDVQIPLTEESLKGTFEGTEYIRYVRMIPSK